MRVWDSPIYILCHSRRHTDDIQVATLFVIFPPQSDTILYTTYIKSKYKCISIEGVEMTASFEGDFNANTLDTPKHGTCTTSGAYSLVHIEHIRSQRCNCVRLFCGKRNDTHVCICESADSQCVCAAITSSRSHTFPPSPIHHIPPNSTCSLGHRAQRTEYTHTHTIYVL